MKENTIRAELGDLRISAVLFDEAFQLKTEDTKKGEFRPLHRHSDYEIFFILRGELLLQGNGTVLRAGENSVVIVPPLFEHTTHGGVISGYCMYFRPETRAKFPNANLQAVTDSLKDKITLLPLSEAGNFYIRQLAKTVKSPHGRGEEGHLVSLLFAELLRPLLPRPTDGDEKNLRHINIIDLYVAEHYREKIRLSDLAKTLYLCPKQVTRIIRKKYACSFSDLVHDHRLRLARTMLESTEESITSIAQAVGYEYENYFYALFRKAYAMTPTEYREKHKSLKTS